MCLSPAELGGEMIELGLDGGDPLELHVQRALHAAAEGFKGGETFGGIALSPRVRNVVTNTFRRTLTATCHEPPAILPACPKHLA